MFSIFMHVGLYSEVRLLRPSSELIDEESDLYSHARPNRIEFSYLGLKIDYTVLKASWC